MKRASTAKFMPNAAVFPGGTVDKADLDVSAWHKLFTAVHGETELGRLKDSLIFPTQPEMYVDGNDSKLPNQILFRITAIRELLEESGVFVGTNGVHEVSKADRERIYKEPEWFVEYCKNLKSAPAVNRLYEWSVWLTPTHILPKRFDTVFYLLALNQEESRDLTFHHDNSELITTTWEGPHQTLHHNARDKTDTDHTHLHPPQYYELARMLNFRMFYALEGYAKVRQQKFGTQRWLPVITDLEKGIRLSLMPGDKLYPEDPDVLGNREPRFQLSPEDREEALAMYKSRYYEKEDHPINRTYWDLKADKFAGMTTYSVPSAMWPSSMMLECGQAPPLNVQYWPGVTRND